MPLRGTILVTLKRLNGDRAFYNPSPQQIEKPRPEFKISEWLDCVGVEGLESVTASRENYDVEVRCVSGVRDRYYDPKIGRYITSDPIGLRGGLNTFAYVGSNPLIYMDDEGLFRKQILKCAKNPKKCFQGGRKTTCNGLNSLMHLYCDRIRSCSGNDDCPVLKTKRKQLKRCIFFRNAVSRCHGKKNDPNPEGHKTAITQLRNRIKTCNSLMRRAKCCGG